MSESGFIFLKSHLNSESHRSRQIFLICGSLFPLSYKRTTHFTRFSDTKMPLYPDSACAKFLPIASITDAYAQMSSPLSYRYSKKGCRRCELCLELISWVKKSISRWTRTQLSKNNWPSSGISSSSHSIMWSRISLLLSWNSSGSKEWTAWTHNPRSFDA